MIKILFLVLASTSLLFGATIQTLQKSYPSNSIITVKVTGLPATTKCNPNLANNDCNWVGLFYAFDGSSPENLLDFRTTADAGDATFTFAGLHEAHNYEARVFFKNNYNEKGFYPFTITTAQKVINLKTIKNSYTTKEAITVHVTGMPGNQSDWIGLFSAYDNSIEANLIKKIETKGVSEGNFTFDALTLAGDYEVRAFKNGTFNEEDFYPFTVTTAPMPHTKCNILQNPSFEVNTDSWLVYGGHSIVNGGYEGAKALSINHGGFDQITTKITGPVDTYQFNGYYRTEGKTSGIWYGMIFYDANMKELYNKELYLKDSLMYREFVMNATIKSKVKYIETWFWADGKVLVDNVKLSTSSCYDYPIASALPPGKLTPSQVPQFVTLGFDDNTEAKGIDWVSSVLSTKINPDGSKATYSLYFNTKGFKKHEDDNPVKLVNAVKRLALTDNEIGNHTDTHFSQNQNEGEDHFFNRIRKTDYTKWGLRIQNASDDLASYVGVSNVKGFRAPYLLYNHNSMQYLKDKGFLYDCSIEEGYSPEFDGTNFRWPHPLDGGSPGHDESDYGNQEENNYVDIGKIEGFWELPAYAVMIPKDSECAKYGIKSGLWTRMKKNVPYEISDHRFTGLDYNLWSLAKFSKAEMLGVLKYNLDLRYNGNRAPFMFGTHSQYYTKDWADDNAPNATVKEMKESIVEFLDYARSKQDVRIKKGTDVIEWCKNPQPL